LAQRPFRTYDQWCAWRDQVYQDLADRNARRKREAEERGETPPDPIEPSGKVAAWLREFEGDSHN